MSSPQPTAQSAAPANLIPTTSSLQLQNREESLGIPMAQDHAVCQNSDGSLDLYVQADPPPDPTSIAYCNWLPSPAGAEFTRLLRMYMPDQAVINGQ